MTNVIIPLDVDECSSNNGGCEQGCHNVVGSHICSCRLGYYLDLVSHSSNHFVVTFNQGRNIGECFGI